MQVLARLPYRKKIRLAITAISIIVIGLCATIFIVYQIATIRKVTSEKADNIARVIAANITVAVTRDENLIATRELSSLRTVTEVVAAYAIMPTGKPFANYQRTGAKVSSPLVSEYSEGINISIDSLAHLLPLEIDGRNVGYLLIEFDPDVLSDQVNLAALSLLTGTVIAMLLSWGASLIFEPFITSPIFQLSAIANTIAHKKDYSLRAPVTTNDEIGLLAENINSMLAQIERRDLMLQRHKEDLESLITERTKKLSRANSALIESEKKMRLVSDNLPMLIAYVDSSLYLTFHNNAYSEWFNQPFPSQGIVSLSRAYGDENIAMLMTALPELLQGQQQQLTSKFNFSDGSTKFVEITAVPHIEEFQEVRGFILLVRDTTTQRDAERRLRQAKDAAEDNARTKSDFVANISHELRTPINGVIGATELALLTELNDEQREYLDIIRSSSESLLQLINDVLSFSALGRDNFSMNNQQFNLREFLDKTISLIGVIAREKHITLTCSVEQTLPEYVVTDSRRLKQVLLNLLSNAVKFTPTNGEIILSATWDNSCIMFAVTDNGIGIDKSQQEKIFAPFVQADTSSTRCYGGTGLGLSIAADIVNHMGGYLSVDSEPGKGSTFYFPIQIADVRTDNSHPDTDDTVAASPSGQFRGSALLVEDNLVNQKVASAILGKLGLDVRLAVNGLEALKMVEENSFDIIFMDCQMPVMDGFEATRAIHRMQSQEQKQTPIVALTAHVMAGDEEKCLQHGMDGYLAKPIDLESLTSILRKHLG